MNRTIHDIIPPSRRKAMGMDPQNTSANQEQGSVPPVSPVPPTPSWTPPNTPESDTDNSNTPVPPTYARKVTRRHFPIGTAIVALIVVAASAGVLVAFSKAQVKIVPVEKTVTVDTPLTATAASGDLPFEIVSVDKTASVQVPAETTGAVNDPASGSITVMNTQNVPQPLITNTRFASPEGKVFRIHSAITVPAGTASAPGNVTTTVYADQGGDSYNIAPTTFTLPGLKGGASYALVTAKSSAAFTGGFSGTRASVSSATDTQQQASLQVGLASDLKAAIASKVPNGYLLIPGSTFTTYAPQPDAAGDASKVAISLKGTLSAVVIPNAALAKAIAYKTDGTYAGQPITIVDANKLTLTPENPDESPTASPTFAFNLTGTATLRWTIDPSHIQSAVAGKTRESAQVVLRSLPEVDSAVLVLRPFWAQTFPQDPSKIRVSTTTASGS